MREDYPKLTTAGVNESEGDDMFLNGAAALGSCALRHGSACNEYGNRNPLGFLTGILGSKDQPRSTDGY